MNNRSFVFNFGWLNKEYENFFFNIIGKRPEEVKILYTPTAGIETDGAREGIAVCLYELLLMGIQSENILIYNLELILSKGYKRTYSAYVTDGHIASRLINTEELKEFDAVLLVVEIVLSYVVKWLEQDLAVRLNKPLTLASYMLESVQGVCMRQVIWRRD